MLSLTNDLGPFLLSPGFGGAAAVVAALIALVGVWRAAQVQRDGQRTQQWWDRARWALDLTCSEDVQTRVLGYAVFRALAESSHARKNESQLIAAITEERLDDLLDGAVAPPGGQTGGSAANSNASIIADHPEEP